MTEITMKWKCEVYMLWNLLPILNWWWWTICLETFHKYPHFAYHPFHIVRIWMSPPKHSMDAQIETLNVKSSCFSGIFHHIQVYCIVFAHLIAPKQLTWVSQKLSPQSLVHGSSAKFICCRCINMLCGWTSGSLRFKIIFEEFHTQCHTMLSKQSIHQSCGVETGPYEAKVAEEVLQSELRMTRKFVSIEMVLILD